MAGKSPYSSFYPINTGEIDLRTEFSNILYGSSDEIKKGRIGLLRKMRRDSEGNLIRCQCRDPLTDEPDRDHFCRYCHGMGWYWDERQITFFVNDDSYKRTEGYNREYIGDLVYLEYNIDITDEDYIVIIRTNYDGNVIIPVERLNFYKVYDIKPYRSDYGRIEFITARTREEQKWSTWYGVKLRNQ